MSGERIYVAARFRDYARARALMDDLTAAGHTITHDWTRTGEFGADGHPAFGAESEIPRERSAEHAVDDIRGVRTADRVAVLADESLCGALIVVGAALALGIPVWVADPWRLTIFWEHPLVMVFPSVGALREALI